MQSKLLEWATTNSEAAKENRPLTEAELQATHARVGALDPAIVEMLLGRDETVVMRELSEKIGNNGDRSEEANALIELEAMVESLDNAVNMGKMGLWKSVLSVVRGGERDNAHYALSLIGNAAQNNTLVQNDLVEMGALNDIIHLLAAKEENIALKAIYAASALIRNERQILEGFIAKNGMEGLKMALQNHAERARPRLEHLMNVLAHEYPDLSETFQIT